MLAKLIAFFLLIGWSYVLSVFVVPDMADQYGNTELNAKIRIIKDQSLNYASGSESPTSLAEKVLNTSKNLVDETKQTVENTQKVVTEKTEQAKKAAESVEKAYNALEEAKTDIKNLTNFSGASLSGSIQP